MGLNKTDAEMLLRKNSKNEIIDALKFYDKSGNRSTFLDYVRDTEKEEFSLWGRVLNFGKRNEFVWDKDALEQDIMSITRKYRTEQNFKKGLLHCKELPEALRMTPEDKAAKAIIDKGFAKLPRTKYEMMQYRGEVVAGYEPWTKKVLSLKKGDTFEMPGYCWTTDSQRYAFGSYSGDGNLDFLKEMNRYSIKYNILCPEGTQIMASRSRMGQEFVMPCDSKMKLVKKVVDEENRTIEIFCEHIPNKPLDMVS